MKQLAEWCTDKVQTNQSRRGFLATCGKAVLFLGGTMLGFDRTPSTAHAGCCVGSACLGCSPSPSATGCPSGCTVLGSNGCCDTGGTGTLHICYLCSCPGGVNCNCEYDLGGPPC